METTYTCFRKQFSMFSFSLIFVFYSSIERNIIHIIIYYILIHIHIYNKLYLIIYILNYINFLVYL
jgi:hypothetical protein